MPQYRKRPVVIEAIQFIGGSANTQECLGFDERIYWGNGPGLGPHPGYLYIKTLEGTMEASAGDWIIRGVKGEVYPCKPDIFAATYEPAEGE